MLISPSHQNTHHVRTFFAGLLGTIAVSLILLSITVVWLNRTLTDNATYVATVTPLATKPAIQNFIAEKLTEQILNSSQTQDLALTLLPPSAFSQGVPIDQLQAQLNPVIRAYVLQVVRAPKFVTLWVDTNKSLQSSLVRQLNQSNLSQLTFDLTPMLKGAIELLQDTQLGPVAATMNIAPGSGVVTVQDSRLAQFHWYYLWFQESTIAILVSTAVLFVAAVLLSVEHIKTLRRILVGVGILAFIQALILWAPSVTPLPVADSMTLDAARALEQVLVHNLFIASLIVGIMSLALAIASRVYESILARR